MFKRILLGLLLLGIAGCEATNPFGAAIGGAVQGYIYWREGEARKYFKRSPEDVYSAIKLTVLNDLQHEIITEQRINGYEMLTKSKNHKFLIRVEQTDPMVSVCKIRVDFMGDKPYAELLYRTMDKYLGTTTIGVIEETGNQRRLIRKYQ